MAVLVKKESVSQNEKIVQKCHCKIADQAIWNSLSGGVALQKRKFAPAAQKRH